MKTFCASIRTISDPFRVRRRRPSRSSLHFPAIGPGGFAEGTPRCAPCGIPQSGACGQGAELSGGHRRASPTSGIYDRALKTGAKAPDFTLKNAEGQPTRLSELLKKGPVVLTWYRGGWCPYCNLALAALAEKMPEITAAGGQLVALTPELPEHADETAKKQKLPFQVLSDIGNRVAREYGVVFKMTPDVAAAMQKGAKLHERNGDASDELPLGAAYVIAPDGTVTYAFLDADYRNRAEPARLVDALQAIKTGAPTPEHMLLQFWEGVWNPPYDIALVDRLMTEDFVITSAGDGRPRTRRVQRVDRDFPNKDRRSAHEQSRHFPERRWEARRLALGGDRAQSRDVRHVGR